MPLRHHRALTITNHNLLHSTLLSFADDGFDFSFHEGEDNGYFSFLKGEISNAREAV